MSQRVFEEVTPGEEADMTSHIRSSSRPRSIQITTPTTSSIAANSANSAMQPFHVSESGRKGETPSSAKPSLLQRNHSTTARSLHAARSTVPGASETSSSRGPTSSPSPPLSVSHSVSTNLPPSTASYSIPQLGASPAHSRSATARRQPASRSSHGIETSTGPPPALSTQRSYTTEVTRRRPAPSDLIVSRPSLRGRSQTDSRIDTKAQRRDLSVDDDHTRVGPWESPSVERRETEHTKNNMDFVSASYQSLDDDTDRTLRGLRTDEPSPTLRALGEPAQQDQNSQSSQEEKHPESVEEDEHSKSSQEDLFLNLAKSDTLADDAADGSSRSESKSERRRSRVSISTSQPPNTPLQSIPRPSSSGRQIQGHSVSSSHDSPRSYWNPSRPFQEPNLQFSGRNVSPRDRSYAAPSHPLDIGNGDHHSGTGSSKVSRIRSGSNQETTPDRSAAYGGRQSIREPPPVLAPRAYRQSNLSYSTNGRAASGVPESNFGSRRRLQSHQAEDSESIVSTTAPSTVWTNFEELKYRIQNLGRLAAPSGGGERPRTASTTTTTISTSPYHPKPLSRYRPSIMTDETQIHPLLRAALAKSKSMMEPKFYQPLEATTSDALKMAGMLGSVVGLEPSPSSASHPWNARPLREKADNLCRSLTELCMVLSEEQSEEADAGQGAHEDRSVSLSQGGEDEQGPAYARASSEDPEYRSSSRIEKRIEARRRSMVVFSNNRSRQESPSQFTTPILARRGGRNEEQQQQPDEPHYYNDHHYNDPHYNDHRYNDSCCNDHHYNDHHYTDPHYNHRHHNDYHHNDHQYNDHQYNNHHHNDHQYNNHHHNDHHHVRPASRAATEIGTHFRPSPLSRGPPEYAPEHPPPNRHRRSPSVQSSLPRRGSYFPPSSPHSQSMTPNVFPSNRRCFDCLPPPTASEAAELAEMAEMRRWRLTSLGISEANLRVSKGVTHQHEGDES